VGRTTCAHCGAPLTAQQLALHNEFCSRACFGEARRAATEARRGLVARKDAGDRRHRNGKRAHTIAGKRLTLVEQAAARRLEHIDDPDRPRTRGDCVGGERPCPYVSCSAHLYLDVNPETGALKLNFPDLEPQDLKESCALDVADLGGVTLEEVGGLMNLTREAVRQIETRALHQLHRAGLDLGETPPVRRRRA
jgi:hypothetical protein